MEQQITSPSNGFKLLIEDMPGCNVKLLHITRYRSTKTVAIAITDIEADLIGKEFNVPVCPAAYELY